MPSQTEWFCALLDSASDVFFRYSLTTPRGFAYISPSVRTLTGRTADDFHADRNLCLSLISAADRPLLRRLLRAHRRRTTIIRLVRHGLELPVELQTVALIRRGRVVAIEGVVRLAVTMPAAAAAGSAGSQSGTQASEPIQQRLTALLVEVHELLHRVLPSGARASVSAAPNVLRLGDLALDVDRMAVTESGTPVVLTPREVQVLKYLLERPGRIVRREQLLADVWSYQYMGDARTVDVHMSRLRRKLPSLHGRLVAIRNLGYRIDDEHERRIANC